MTDKATPAQIQQKLEEMLDGTRKPETIHIDETRKVDPDYVVRLLTALDPQTRKEVRELSNCLLDEYAFEITGTNDADNPAGHTILDFHAYLMATKKITHHLFKKYD